MKSFIKSITGENFKKYGFVIQHDFLSKTDNQVIFSESSTIGWMMSALKINEKEIHSLSSHPNTMESFEPLEGVTLLYVSTVDNESLYEIFLLDRPVCLQRGIWHGLLALSEYSIVKLVENSDVVVVKRELPDVIRIVAESG